MTQTIRSYDVGTEQLARIDEAIDVMAAATGARKPRAARNALNAALAQMLVLEEELRPRRMSAYGAVDADAEALLDAHVQQLVDLTSELISRDEESEAVMPFARILVALNGEPEGEQALKAAIALASALQSDLQAVVVEGRLPKYAATIGEVDDAKHEKDELLATVTLQAQAQAAEAGLELDIEYAAGAPTDAIVRIASRDDCDLIVVGYHKHLFGGLADHLGHHAPCPVLVVRGKHE